MIQERGVLNSTLTRFGLPVRAEEVCHLDSSRSKDNVPQIALLLGSWIALLADSPLDKLHHTEKPARVARRFRSWLITGPLVKKVKLLSTLADLMMETSYQTGQDAVTGIFLDHEYLEQMQIPDRDLLPQGIMTLPIFKEYLTWFRTGDPQLAQYLLTFLLWGKKLDFADPAMDQAAFRSWTEVEQKLSDLQLPQNQLQDLKEVMELLIGDFKLDGPLQPKFGPGAVAESGVRGDIRKSYNIRFDAKIDRLFFSSLQMVMHGSEEDGYTVKGTVPDPQLWSMRDQPSRNYSKLIFVPKNVFTSRTICSEPNTYQWAQQGVLDNVLGYFRSGPMRNISDLKDQSRNRALGQFGSLTTELDTIDLSSASDSVSIDLIRGSSPRVWLYAQLATRTSSVQLPFARKPIEVKKFAPMGSALCFVTQCLIFAGIAILAAMQEAEGMPVETTSRVSDRWFKSSGDSLRHLFAGEPGYHHLSGKFQPLVVYGDDIVVDARLTARVVHLLSAFGFTVNTKKSFGGGQSFRETCGGYYYCGEDVTPLRYSIKRNVAGGFKSHVMSTIAQINKMGDGKYFNTKHFLLCYAESICKDLLYSSDRNAVGAIYTTKATNSHLKTRYNKHLQRDEVRHISIAATKKLYDETSESIHRRRKNPKLKPIIKEETPFDQYRLGRWWASHAGDSVEPEEFSFGVPAYERTDVKLCRRWTPVE